MTLHPANTNLTISTPLTLYPLKDHQNSILAFTDASGTIVESYEYDAWGRVLSVKDCSGNALTSDLGLPTSGIGNRYTFQGREIDWNTGLIYFRARWYSPETGRWLSKDPIGISGGLNLYVAFNNSPVNYTDATGLCPSAKDLKNMSKEELIRLLSQTADENLKKMILSEYASKTWGFPDAVNLNGKMK